jgi:serine/threonine protein phosphatase PrpC
MSESNTIIVYGKDHESSNEIYCQKLEYSNIAYGISVGVMAKANEDCLGISVSGDEILMAVADGHWGMEASELAIDKTMEMIRSTPRPSKEGETRARFYALFEQINQELFVMGMAHPGALTPETTLIVCQLKEFQSEKYLYWSSFGDSYLFVFRNNGLIQVNSLNAYWLGMLSRMSDTTGVEKLYAGDTILLCTDGLIGSDEGVPDFVDKNIKAILTTAVPLEQKVSNLIMSAIDRSESDNISCILAQIS